MDNHNNPFSDLAIESDLQAISAPVFIEANTLPVSMNELLYGCTIPVFAKDNEAAISHHEFIEAVLDGVSAFYHSNDPVIRVSHPVKGRIPEARHKKASDLESHEETLYYERMMFAIEIPSVKRMIGDDELTLTIGGVKSYHLENLHSKKSLEKFKLFIGFKNRVCCNLCVWTDGIVDDLRVFSVDEITQRTKQMIREFEPQATLDQFERWQNINLTEQQFAEFIGRCRMYLYMPKEEKAHLSKLEFGDSQINQVVEGYYNDPNFSRTDGEINLWRLYNLFTGANKSSYIDRLLDRGVNASSLLQAFC